MSEKSKKELLEEKKVNLVNDLIATNTVTEEVWKYHPDNPNKHDVVEEYNQLKQIINDIEEEIVEVENQLK